jgi:hypothetical protein
MQNYFIKVRNAQTEKNFVKKIVLKIQIIFSAKFDVILLFYKS